MSDYQLSHEESSSVPPKHHLVVIAENMHSPENVGGIFRIAEAMGVHKIFLTGTTPDLKNRKVKKTARDTHQRVPSEIASETSTLLPILKSAGYQILGLEITQQSLDLRKIDLKVDQKYAIVIGSERNGIQEDTLLLIDQCIHIPMFGNNSSMNVATALGIGLWEMVRRLN